MVEQRLESKAALARFLGISAADAGRYVEGKQGPSQDALLLFEEKFGVEIHWLLTGREPQKRGELIRPELALRVLTLHEARKTLTPQEIKDSWAELPLVGEAAAAGEPRLVPGDKVEDWLLAPKRWVKHEGYACVRVRGRSMLPVLGDGDIVAVNHERRDLGELRGLVIAFEVPEEGVTLKYGDLVDDIIYMWAENKVEWPGRPYRADRVTVIGAVEWAWRRFE